MSTISSKFVPDRAKHHNKKPITGVREATLHRVADSEVLKSSVCFAEPRADNTAQILYNSTKKLDYDELGKALLDQSIVVEKESVERLIQDMRSKHYDFGNDEPSMTSLHQDSFGRPSSQYLNEAKENIVKRGSDLGHTKVLGLPPSFGYYTSDKSRDEWKKDTISLTEKKPGEGVNLHNAREECEQIKTMMRNSHFFFGDEPRHFSTVQKTSYDEKQGESSSPNERTKRGLSDSGPFVLGAPVAGKKNDPSTQSSIVYGYQDGKQRKSDMSSVYNHEIAEKARFSNNTPDMMKTRQKLRETLAASSVIYGSEDQPERFVSHSKSEYREITYKR